MQKAHCAVLRIKDCLSYRLGQALIDYDKNGGGLCLLIKKLYHISKTHQRTQRLYKDFISLYPHLKYPALEQCSDYEEALRYKYHLSYLLGQALIKAHKSWYRGGYLKLYTSIKDARKIYKEFKQFIQDHQDFKLNNSSLILIFENKEFINDEEYKNYLTFLLQHLNPKQKQEFIKLLFSLPNSNSLLKEFKELFEEFKDYEALLVVLKHNISFHLQFINNNLTLIKEWLHSKEFKEKYLDTKHPYPSLLNPLKLDYESVDAELAWDMNVPLPRCYEFIFLGNYGAGSAAMQLYLSSCGIHINRRISNNQQRYIDCFKLCKHNQYNALVISGYRFTNDNDKLYFLITKKVPILCIVRDPISVLKPIVNHHETANSYKAFPRNISLKSDYKHLIQGCIKYQHYVKTEQGLKYTASDHPTLANLYAYTEGNHFILKERIDILKNIASEILYFDMEAIKGKNTFKTFNRLKEILHFPSLREEQFYSSKVCVNDILLALPVTLSIPLEYTELKIDILITTYNSIPKNNEFIDLKRQLFNNEVLFEHIVYLVKKEDYSKLINNSKLFNDVKKYLIELTKTLEEQEKIEVNKQFKEKDILEYFRKNKDLRDSFKKIFDKEYAHLKQVRPDIVASWNYYNEFEKICEEFDKH
ncbi:DUF2972 domain-containing protein [Campylobacter cuniculorum]|uniref:DUF2972 domain-containing protein n=2 Tax=Campylobacter cuniculorum TaxID=374106 RepID=A0A1W6BUN9_9BACT|nr:DUF2972 domain-containing protein [Campylobacter cuniculorum]ARJ55813.1 hypothetical protein (DUF2972 domain) [Campylobacter cuniculorum DSM 23162 = LMG 24588]